MLDWGRRAVVVGTAVLWLLMAIDALPWGLDLDEGGAQGLVRAAALVGAAGVLVIARTSRPVEEVYRAGFAAGQRAAIERRVDCRGSSSAAAVLSERYRRARVPSA